VKSGSESAQQEWSGPAWGSGEQCDEADNFVPLFIGSVDELNAIAAGSAVRDADREIDTHTLKCDVDRPRGIDGERPAHVKLHAFSTNLDATAEERGFLERQAYGEVNGKSRSAIIKFPHSHPISTDRSSSAPRRDSKLAYRHIGGKTPVERSNSIKKSVQLPTSGWNFSLGTPSWVLDGQETLKL